jgi:hypothetical protein
VDFGINFHSNDHICNKIYSLSIRRFWRNNLLVKMWICLLYFVAGARMPDSNSNPEHQATCVVVVVSSWTQLGLDLMHHTGARETRRLAASTSDFLFATPYFFVMNLK